MPDIPKDKNYRGGRGSYTQNTGQNSAGNSSEYSSASVSTIENGSFNEEGLIYKVQILTSGTELGEDDPRLKNAEAIWSYKHGGLIKYTSGEFSSLQEANAHKQACREKGFSGAFVVKFKNDKRLL